MIPLLSLIEAKDDLKVSTDDEDSQIALLVDMASDIVMGYIKKDAEALEWDEFSVPFRIKAAVILVLRALYHGGDNDPLGDTVRRLLHRDRDPTCA